MKIRRVRIHNWRSIKDTTIDFKDLMVFVGQNNHGKSNIFSAILFFFGATPNEKDINQGATEAFVEITFDELEDKDKDRFSKYLDGDSALVVRRQIEAGGNPVYHGYCEIPDPEWLKEENAANFKSRTAIKDTPLVSLVGAGSLTIGDVRDAQRKYIAEHRAEIVFTRGMEEGPFGGQKSLPPSTFGEVFYIPAVKNAADDLNPKKDNPFNNLLTGVINEMSAENDAYIGVKEKVKILSERLNKKLADGRDNPDRPQPISRLEELIEKELSNWSTKVEIEIAPPDIDEALKLGTNIAVDDGISTEINRKGNGLQRTMIFALVKAWAKVSSEQKAKRIETPDSEVKESKSAYFLFEEPELYLHPQMQRELFSSLKDVSETESQVFLSTHSSAFVDLGRSESICVVCKNSLEEGTTTLQSTEKLFEDLAEEKRFNLTYWINPDRGELFFAKRVILVEGPTDKSVIPYTAKRLGYYRHDFSLTDCGGRQNIPLFLRLLNNFKLKYVVVYDRDHQEWKEEEKRQIADNENAQIEAAIDPSLGFSIVFENDIEEEVGLVASKKSKPYKALEHIAGTGYEYPGPFKDKIQRIYRDM